VKIRQQIKDLLKWDSLSYEEQARRRNRHIPYLRVLARIAGFLQLDIRLIALLSLTDKVGSHEYTDAYAEHFKRFRNRKITLLEIGVGGYAFELGGRSLVLWNAYFQNAKIAAIDILDKTSLSRGRIKVFQCSQVDQAGLQKICDTYGGFDIIIDDGSHISEHMIKSFEMLFSRVRPGGIYVIEDLQCCYIDNYGGGPLGTEGYDVSAMKYLSGIIDAVNMRSPSLKDVKHERPLPRFTKDIAAIHFYEELCVIQKRN
jgi:hypothetical protein